MDIYLLQSLFHGSISSHSITLAVTGILCELVGLILSESFSVNVDTAAAAVGYPIPLALSLIRVIPVQSAWYRREKLAIGLHVK